VDLDLLVVNRGEANLLFINDGAGRFTNRASDFQMGNAGAGQGAAWADYDNDGDIDAFVTNLDASGMLYQNGLSGASYLRVQALTRGRPAVGALIQVDLDQDGDFTDFSGGGALVRTVGVGGGFASQDDVNTLIGLGGRQSVFIQVTFPDTGVPGNNRQGPVTFTFNPASRNLVEVVDSQGR